MTDRPDAIDLLEELYDLERPRAQWFGGVLAAAGPLLDRGAGVGLLLYDVSGPVPRVDAMDGFNVPAENIKVGTEAHAHRGWQQSIIECYRTQVCCTLKEHVPDLAVRASLRERYAAIGIRDQILINGSNRSGFGCALYVFSKTVLQLRRPERELLTRFASHLSTAYRLHRRLGQASSADGHAVDAFLRVDGSVEQAEGYARSREARRSLGAAVKLREWARTIAGRRDHSRATSAWRPLVSGRWSLVDSYERGGRRYITACENTPALNDLRILSPRELQVVSLAELGRSNKVIAYELGLGHSTVRVLLARAASKLAVRTRTELITKFRDLRRLESADSADPPPSSVRR
jgi:DNA-binding CsgD family transcriptional regulator